MIFLLITYTIESSYLKPENKNTANWNRTDDYLMITTYELETKNKHVDEINVNSIELKLFNSIEYNMILNYKL